MLLDMEICVFALPKVGLVDVSRVNGLAIHLDRVMLNGIICVDCSSELDMSDRRIRYVVVMFEHKAVSGLWQGRRSETVARRGIEFQSKRVRRGSRLALHL